VCVRLVGDSPRWKGFGWLVRLADGRDFGRGTALVTTTQVATASSALLPGGGGVVPCRVCCSCALSMCDGVSFGFDVKLLLLLI
jgi:hypothetical protein